MVECLGSGVLESLTTWIGLGVAQGRPIYALLGTPEQAPEQALGQGSNRVGRRSAETMDRTVGGCGVDVQRGLGSHRAKSACLKGRPITLDYWATGEETNPELSLSN